jgi:hypothetical protein
MIFLFLRCEIFKLEFHEELDLECRALCFGIR